jgi:hypothetical protein
MNLTCKFVTPHVCVVAQLPHSLALVVMPCHVLSLSLFALPCHIVIWSLKILGRCVISFLWTDSTQKEKKKESRHIWQRKVPTSTTKFEGNKMLVYLIFKPHSSFSCLSPPTPPRNLPISFRITFFAFFPGYFFFNFLVSFVFGKS